MTIERKKIVAKTLRELYPFPHYSKLENVICGFIWIISWIVGILMNHSADQRALGGAYFILSLSIFIDIVQMKKTQAVARWIQGGLSVVLFAMLLLSAILIFGNESEYNSNPVLPLIITILGWVVMGVIACEIVLVLFELHKLFYDEEAERASEKEAEQALKLKIFTENLKGKNEGGKKK